MKINKIHVLAIIAILVLAGCTQSTLKDSNDIKKNQIQQQNEETQIENTIDDSQALIHKEFGEVFVTLPNKEEINLQNDISIPSGTIIKTGNGSAIVAFIDNSVMTIDKNTEVEVTYTDTDISIMQNMGNTWHRVSSLVSSDNSYEVTTPTALATVRGTIFGVKVSKEGTTNVIVKESVVDISEMPKEKTPESKPEFVASVKAGEGFFETKRGAEMKPTMIRKLEKADFENEWIKQNEIIDTNWSDIKQIERPKIAPANLMIELEMYKDKKPPVKTNFQELQIIKPNFQQKNPKPNLQNIKDLQSNNNVDITNINEMFGEEFERSQLEFEQNAEYAIQNQDMEQLQADLDRYVQAQIELLPENVQQEIYENTETVNNLETTPSGNISTQTNSTTLETEEQIVEAEVIQIQTEPIQTELVIEDNSTVDSDHQQ